MGLDLSVYGLQEWADSALFTISICILSGNTVWFQLGVWLPVLAAVGRSDCIVIMTHTQLVRLQEVN
ncbi:hypothetical protein ACN42_g4271 [Penicillium freii]|uniref:Uncharacterized protein n=1 Tax=Penicillium freii TaxID=48697 RepID=A0A117NPT3_PENFR|nr:hypothetical protein ACN42_g4271 [Penicillium freii]